MGADSMNHEELLRVEDHGGVISLSLCSPSNRFSLSLIEELHGRVQDLKHRLDVGAVWLRADGDNFSPGADLKDPRLATLVLQDDNSRRRLAALGQSLIENWMSLSVPTVVSCQGFVLGAGACLMCSTKEKSGCSTKPKGCFTTNPASCNCSR